MGKINHDEYILFIDESCMKDIHHAVGGVIIKKVDLEDLENKINNLKEALWGETFFHQNKNICILHATELNNFKKNLSNKKINKNTFGVLKGVCKENLKAFSNKLCQFVRENDITPIFAIVNEKKFREYYNYEDNKSIKRLDFQLFCFEKIVHSYIHFLEQNNGIGEVIYEAQLGNSNLDSSPDHKITNRFYEIRINNKGMNVFDSKITTNRLRNIKSVDKNSNNNFLQIADCLLFNFLVNIIKGNIFADELSRNIYKKIYNGNIDPAVLDIREFWGVSTFPYDIIEIRS